MTLTSPWRIRLAAALVAGLAVGAAFFAIQSARNPEPRGRPLVDAVMRVDHSDERGDRRVHELDVVGGRTAFVGAVHEPDGSVESVEVRLDVVSRSGDAVAGAAIVGYAAGATSFFGETNVKGQVTWLQPKSDETLHLTVDAAEFAVSFLDVSCSEDTAESVVLRASGSISGVIEMSGQGDLPGDLRVVASEYAERMHVVRDRKQEQRLLAARSAAVDDNGAFDVGRLVEGEHYYLDIVGAGVAPRTGFRARRFVASSADVKLSAYRLFGKIVKFACADGGELGAGFRPEFSIRSDPELRSVAGRLGREYAGPGTQDLPRGDDVLALVYAVDDRIVREPEVTLVSKGLGFKSYRETIELTPMGEDGFETHVAELVRTADRFGSIAVRVIGEAEETLPRRTLTGSLQLQAARAARTDSIRLSLAPGETAVHCPGIPVGDYDWTFSSWRADIRLPAEGAGTISVAEGERAGLVLELPPLGYLQMTCVDQHGAGRAADLRILRVLTGRDGRDRNGWISGFHCDPTPTLFGPLSPGQYNVTVPAPRSLPGGEHKLMVRKDQVTKDVIVLPSR